MSEIFALNFDSLSSPSVQLKLQVAEKESRTLGWGIGWYPGDNQGANVVKNPVAKNKIVMSETLADWKSFRSTLFMCKVKDASEGYTHHETQPFSRSFAGRDWLFLHNGNLDKRKLKKLYVNKSGMVHNRPVFTNSRQASLHHNAQCLDCRSAYKDIISIIF
ncbi:MAG: hypothetical protein GY821_17975 [Gammaproteobacteria bacterium]|nr:hypothetical protein [Gammaproteobacteria bacterium]